MIFVFRIFLLCSRDRKTPRALRDDRKSVLAISVHLWRINQRSIVIGF